MTSTSGAFSMIGTGFRAASGEALRACCCSLSVVLLLASTLAFHSVNARAICNVIPGVESEFRGALGSLNRPYAIPGDEGERVAITLDPSDCDAASPGFLDLGVGTDPEDSYFVTVVFTPPRGGARNAVVLATEGNESACLAAIAGIPAGVSATCRVPDPGFPQEFQIENPSKLVFDFPNTDAELAPDDDDRTFSGPTTIAVTPVSAPLPFVLANARCADTPGLVACIDELYARDGTCATGATHLDPVFGHFTALPPANDYQALCTTTNPGAPCTGEEDELRFTVDAAGNALVPMDYRGVLVRNDQIPIPRLILGDTEIEAFSGTSVGIDLQSAGFLASYSPGGHRLPPVFTPLSNPEAEGALSLFGSVDAPVGVIRVTRQGCVGGSESEEGAPCTTDAQCGAEATCEQLFDFSDRLEGGVGPVLIAETEFELQTQNPVELAGLIESDSMFAFVVNEAIEGVQLNDDDDATDPVLRLRDRGTGAILPIGTDRAGTGQAAGRAVTRVKDGRFRFPAVTAEGDIAAFLELEPLEGYQDTNDNGSIFDPILRVYRVAEDCGGGTSCAEELTASLPIPFAVDAAPLVEGRSVAISAGQVYFRVPEWRQAPQVTERVSVDSVGVEGNDRSESPFVSSDGLIVAFPSQADNLVLGDTNDSSDIFLHDRETGETERISVASDGTEGDGVARHAAISFDGRVVMFDSDADNLAPGDTNVGWHMYVHNRATGATERVSINSDGDAANRSSWESSLSSDGQIVAFSSWADNLVSGDTNSCSNPDPDFFGTSCSDVFVHDRETGTTERVSVSSEGVEGNGLSETPSLSSDGRVVAFTSRATNLVPGDTNYSPDVFVHDRETGETELASISSDGAQGGGWSWARALSADGRVVAFESSANNLVAGDKNNRQDSFVHDRATGETELVSVSWDGSQGNGVSWLPCLSPDGRFVGFQSWANNLVPGDTNPEADIFVHDRVTGATELVSVSQDGGHSFGRSWDCSLSSDGRVVGFQSLRDDLVSGDTNSCGVPAQYGPSCWDVFVRGPDDMDLASDLSGDEDLQDTLLAAFDVATGNMTLLCPAEEVAVHGGSAAFLRPMAGGPCAAAVSGGSGGDPDELAVHLYVPGQGVMDLDRAATAVALSADLVGAIVRGSSGGSDAQAYDRAARSWVSTGQAADSLAVVGTTLAFTSPEIEAGEDLNGDGDLLDRVMQIFRLEGGALEPLLGIPAPSAEELVLGERLVAFRTREASQGEDLNRDGDFSDDVLQVFDLESRRLFNSEQAVTPCPLEACDPRFPYRVEGDLVTFITSEAAQGGEDLNADGDAHDLVKQVFNVREAAALTAGRASGILTATAAASEASALALESVTSIAAASAGICTTTGVACASDADCGGGGCYLPPGGCIEDLKTECSCGLSGCSGCDGDSFCLPYPGGGDRGTCHVNWGPCTSQDDCADDTVCTDAEADIQLLFAPISGGETKSGETFFSSGTCVEDRGEPCGANAPCRPKEVCSPRGTCQRHFGSCRTDDDCRPNLTCAPQLVIVNAADTDDDGVADPFDNCLYRANTDQADENGNGVGDACDLSTADTRVAIDIKPGRGPNPVNPFSRGVVPVALLGSQEFDVADVDRGTLAFGSDGASPAHKAGGHPKDVNHDGFTDLLIHFRVQDSGIALGDTEACLTGETIDGIPFEGCDTITTMPSCGLGYELGALIPLLLVLKRRTRGRRTTAV